MTAALTMAQVAGEIGMALRTFRRERHRLVAAEGFPPPFLTVRPVKWDAEAVREWRAARSRPVTRQAHAPRPDLAARQRLEIERARRG